MKMREKKIKREKVKEIQRDHKVAKVEEVGGRKKERERDGK